MTEPDDRELDQYLKGDSALSRRYRDAAREVAPPALDKAVLARARAAARRKPGGIVRWLTPLALAASVVLAVNLSWNVYQARPLPEERQSKDRPAREEAFTPEPSAAAEGKIAPRAHQDAAAPAQKERRRTELEQPSQEARTAQRLEEDDTLSARQEEAQRRDMMAMRQSQAEGAAAAPAAAPPPAAPLSEPEKIDRLVAYIAGLQGAVFIRNGKEYGPADAAKHLQYKREKAGDRVRTADDFIRLCASHSYTSGEAYLIRFADGRTRTAEDVLREALARLQ